jgi:hypothetical protein
MGFFEVGKVVSRNSGKVTMRNHAIQELIQDTPFSPFVFKEKSKNVALEGVPECNQ